MNHQMLKKQQGLTLVELIIALLISLILTLGIIKIFQQHKLTNNLQQQLSRTQENSRIALSTLLTDIRGSGFIGCKSRSNTHQNIETNIIANSVPNNFNFNKSIIGHKYINGSWDKLLNKIPSNIETKAEALSTLSSLDCGAYTMSNSYSDEGLKINLDNSCNFKKNELAAISDCESIDIFRISNIPTASNNINPVIILSHGGEEKNITSELSKSYAANSKVYKVISTLYYIGKDASNLDENGNKISTLYVKKNQSNSLGLVAGVTDLQLSFGLDTDNNKNIDQHVTTQQVINNSNYDWDQVISTQIKLSLSSENNSNNSNSLNKIIISTGVARNRAL